MLCITACSQKQGGGEGGLGEGSGFSFLLPLDPESSEHQKKKGESQNNPLPNLPLIRHRQL